MNMDTTISETLPGRIYPGGPSASRFWNVPLALKSLCGEIEAAQILIQAHEPLLRRRLAGSNETLTELGMATMCVVTTSLIAERAIKTLIAQVSPKEKPWSRKNGGDGHDLTGLFRQRLILWTKRQYSIDWRLYLASGASTPRQVRWKTF